MSKRFRILLVVVALLVIGGGGWFYYSHYKVGPDNQLTLYGNVDIRQVELAFNDSGRVEKVLVQEGAHVKSGQLLATLDDARFAAALSQAKAEAAHQSVVLEKLLAGSRPEEIAQAKATMEALKITWQNAEANYERSAKLVLTHAISVQQRDDLKAAFEAARQQYEAARQNYTLAVKGPRPEDIAAARAAYKAASDAVTLAQREYDDTRLYAPSDGIVENRILEPGDMASPGTPVFTIALPSPLWVRAYVGERHLGRVRTGMPATVETDSYPGHRYRGWVGYVSPTAEFTPRTVQTPELRTALVYQLRVYVCDDRNELRLGMPATVHIDLTRGATTSQTGCQSNHADAQ